MNQAYDAALAVGFDCVRVEVKHTSRLAGSRVFRRQFNDGTHFPEPAGTKNKSLND